MDAIKFQDVAELLSICGLLHITPEPVKAAQGHWELFDAIAQNGGVGINYSIVYIGADATEIEIQRARQALDGHRASPELRLCVVAPSKFREAPNQMAYLRKTGGRVIDTQEFVTSFAQRQIKKYIEEIGSQAPPDFVSPPIETLNGSGDTTVTSLAELRDFIEHRSDHPPLIALLAEPGQGKTYLGRQLCHALAQRKFIPIFVHAAQWQQIPHGDLASLWKTILFSFRAYNTPINWAEGHEERVVRLLLKLDIFRLVFDGLDEYALQSQEVTNSTAILGALIQLADSAGAPVLVTSRTSFWFSEFSPSAKQWGSNRLLSLQLQPFEQHHAKQYFESKFEGDKKQVQRGVEVFSKLKKTPISATPKPSVDERIDLVGRGFFLALIADLVETGYSADHGAIDEQTATQWVVTQLCEREKVRQKLSLNARDQIKVFKAFTLQILGGAEPSSATLRAVLGDHMLLPAAQVDALVGKTSQMMGPLIQHPLLRMDSPARITFAQEQVMFSFLAETILEFCHERRVPELHNLINVAGFNLTISEEVAGYLVDHIFQIFSPTQAIVQYKAVILTCLQSTSGDDAKPKSKARLFATRLALFAIDRLMPRGSAHRDRTNALLELLDSPRIENLYFASGITRLDLSGQEIKGCIFENVTFFGCQFNSHSKFINCTLSGINFLSCEAAGTASIQTCTLDEAATAVFHHANSRTVKVSEEKLKNDIALLVAKFLPASRAAFKHVNEAELLKGAFGKSVFREDILTSFKQHIIEPFSPNGVQTNDFVVRGLAKKSLLFFHENGVCTGPLKLVLIATKQKLTSA